jgi:hypothetical protein
MRAYEIFAWMQPSDVERMLEVLAEKQPAFYAQALGAAAAAMKARPGYLLKQSMAKRAVAVRRALARVVANEVAEELFAVYFLDCKKDILVEWLDAVGLKHEEGTLQEDEPACPEESKLKEALAAFRKEEEGPDRELLLRAFAAQRSVDWPALEALF